MSGRLLGYPQIVNMLQREVEQDSLSHAYLVLGPQGVGKMTLALDLARSLNCEGSQRPCGECLPCQKTEAGSHPDVQVMGLLPGEKEGERARKEISIDQVRALQHDVSLHPYWGRYRVFIVEGAERLSAEAANCFLKTLEEPPAQAVIILLAEEERALPATVVSRCRRIELRPLPLSYVQEVLLQRGATPEQAQLLSRLSRGCLGLALASLESPALLETRQRALESLQEVLDAGLLLRLQRAQQLAALYQRNRGTLVETLRFWLGWWRDLLLLKAGCRQLVVNADWEASLSQWGARLGLEQGRHCIERLLSTLELLERNVNPRLALEALMLELPAPRRGQAASVGS
jgi:DNA polymerase-3 subunit delta'